MCVKHGWNAPVCPQCQFNRAMASHGPKDREKIHEDALALACAIIEARPYQAALLAAIERRSGMVHALQTARAWQKEAH